MIVAARQHSVGTCAATFMDQKLHLAVECFWGPPHRTWNSDKNGLTESGSWEVVLLYGFPCNVNYGPWLGKAWLGKLKEAREEYGQHLGSVNCPVVLSLLPLLARYRQDDACMTDPGWVQARWEDICNHPVLSTTGPHFTLCRWYSWDDCFLIGIPGTIPVCLS